MQKSVSKTNIPISPMRLRTSHMFTGSSRFPKPKIKYFLEFVIDYSNQKFYNLPSTRSKLAPSFGIGERPTYKNSCTSPVKITTKPISDFDYNPKRGKTPSFKSRGHNTKLTKSYGPGPGSYQVREVPGKDARKTNFGAKSPPRRIFNMQNL